MNNSEEGGSDFADLIVLCDIAGFCFLSYIAFNAVAGYSVKWDQFYISSGCALLVLINIILIKKHTLITKRIPEFLKNFIEIRRLKNKLKIKQLKHDLGEE